MGLTASTPDKIPLVKREEPLLRRISPVFTILSAFIAITALLFNFSVRKRSFTCTYLGSDSVVQIDKGALNAPLTMRYKDRPVESLFKLRFIIKNTGSTAVKGTDVIEPLEIYFPEGYSLLDSPTIEQSHPEFTITAAVDPKNQQKVLIEFPLMNSGDEATISVFALSLASSSPHLLGRIVDVTQISNVDLGKAKATQRPSVRMPAPLVWTLTVLNAVIATSCFIVFLWALLIFTRTQLWVKKWKKKADEVTTRVQDEFAKTHQIKQGTFLESLTYKAIEESALLNAGVAPKPKNTIDTFKEFAQISAFVVPLGTFVGLTAYVLFASSIVD